MTTRHFTRTPGMTAALVAAVLAPLALLGAIMWSLPAAAVTTWATGSTTAPSTGAPAEVRIAHFDHGMPSVDIYLSSFGGSSHKEFVCDLSYGQASAYMPLAPGTYVFSVVPEGQPWTKAMVTQTVQLSGGSDYTVSMVSEQGKDRTILLNDSTTQPSPGDASLRLVADDPGVGPVRVALSNGTVLTPKLAYLEATGYADVSAGTWHVDVYSATSGHLLAGSLPVVVPTGGVDSLVLLDPPNGQVRLELLSDAQGPSAMPAAAPQMGYGGTAPASHIGDVLALVIAAIAGAVLALVARRRILR